MPQGPPDLASHHTADCKAEVWGQGPHRQQRLERTLWQVQEDQASWCPITTLPAKEITRKTTCWLPLCSAHTGTVSSEPSPVTAMKRSAGAGVYT